VTVEALPLLFSPILRASFPGPLLLVERDSDFVPALAF
jgi:hypothetical protein